MGAVNSPSQPLCCCTKACCGEADTEIKAVRPNPSNTQGSSSGNLASIGSDAWLPAAARPGDLGNMKGLSPIRCSEEWFADHRKYDLSSRSMFDDLDNAVPAPGADVAVDDDGIPPPPRDGDDVACRQRSTMPPDDARPELQRLLQQQALEQERRRKQLMELERHLRLQQQRLDLQRLEQQRSEQRRQMAEDRAQQVTPRGLSREEQSMLGRQAFGMDRSRQASPERGRPAQVEEAHPVQQPQLEQLRLERRRLEQKQLELQRLDQEQLQPAQRQQWRLEVQRLQQQLLEVEQAEQQLQQQQPWQPWQQQQQQQQQLQQQQLQQQLQNSARGEVGGRATPGSTPMPGRLGSREDAGPIALSRPESLRGSPMPPSLAARSPTLAEAATRSRQLEPLSSPMEQGADRARGVSVSRSPAPRVSSPGPRVTSRAMSRGPLGSPEPPPLGTGTQEPTLRATPSSASRDPAAPWGSPDARSASVQGTPEAPVLGPRSAMPQDASLRAASPGPGLPRTASREPATMRGSPGPRAASACGSPEAPALGPRLPLPQEAASPAPAPAWWAASPETPAALPATQDAMAPAQLPSPVPSASPAPTPSWGADPGAPAEPPVATPMSDVARAPAASPMSSPASQAASPRLAAASRAASYGPQGSLESQGIQGSSRRATSADRRRPATESSPQMSSSSPQMSSAQSENGEGLILGFRLPDGTEQTIDFGRRPGPLGVDIGGARMPLTVKAVKAGGVFESHGVAKDWQIVSINGERCENKSQKYCLARIMKLQS